MRSFLFCLAGMLFLFASCKKPDYEKVIHDPELYRQTVKKLKMPVCLHPCLTAQ
jgi:hypothetical protein